jgi:2-oxo-4-hydroxy-4-carboxy-5-ureidoimidazoline decarboxylase
VIACYRTLDVLRRIKEARGLRRVPVVVLTTSSAEEDVLDALVRANRDYEARFGYIFIVCASGKTASEMLALLRERLPNEPLAELEIAAAEQRKITAIRLEKLLTEGP